MILDDVADETGEIRLGRKEPQGYTWVKGCFFREFIDFLIAGYSGMTWDPDKRDVDIKEGRR